jgi:phosphate transport system permease protein
MMAAEQSADQNFESLRKRRFKYADETVIRGLLTLCALVSLVTTGAILFVLLEETISFFREVSFAQFFLETNWQPHFEPISFGIW